VNYDQYIKPLDSTKEKIFTIAAKLFADKGFNGVSMREICELSRVSKPTLYYYFGSKEGIYKALINTGLEFTQREFENILAKPFSVKQKLIEIAKLRFRQSLDYPIVAKFFLRLYTSAENLPFLESYAPPIEKMKEIVVNLIQQGIDTGEFGPSVNAGLAAEIYRGTIFYVIVQHLINPKQNILSDDLAENIVEFLFKGLNE
jgi:TetR/AcrR family transcriptional regulator